MEEPERTLDHQQTKQGTREKAGKKERGRQKGEANQVMPFAIQIEAICSH
jgi:hypothetical protein